MEAKQETGTVVSTNLDIYGGGLTEEDILLIDQIANSMIEAGAWERVGYRASETADFVDAYQANVSEPICGIGRHFGGLYVMADHRAGLFSIGSTLTQVLDQHARINPAQLIVRRSDPRL